MAMLKVVVFDWQCIFMHILGSYVYTFNTYVLAVILIDIILQVL